MFHKTLKVFQRKKSIPILPRGARALFFDILCRFLALVLIAAVIAAAISLYGYDQLDPSFNVATDRQVTNLLGNPGSYTADLLLQTLGWGSILILSLLFLAGVRLLRHASRVNLRSNYDQWLSLACIFVSTLLWCGLLAGIEQQSLPSGFTGVLGQRVASIFASLADNAFAITAIAATQWFVYVAIAVIAMITLLFAADISPLRVIVLVTAGLWKMVGIGYSYCIMGLVLVFGWINWFIAATYKFTGQLVRSKLPTSRNNTNNQQAESRFPGGQTRQSATAESGSQSIAGEDPEQSDLSATQSMPEHQFDQLRPGESGAEESTTQQADGSADSMAAAFADMTDLPASSQPLDHDLAEDASAETKERIPEQRDAQTYTLPPLELLKPDAFSNHPEVNRAQLQQAGMQLKQVLSEFGIEGEIMMIRPGPVITLFELRPKAGTKINRIISLSEDIAREMKALSVRVAAVPGRDVIGLEIPNPEPQAVSLHGLLESNAYKDTFAALPLALGRDIAGRPAVVDLARMPHLLIAGTTGSGKSVAINAMILSLLYCHTPDKCRLILIDPKMLELSVYDEIPHLMCPVVTDPKKAITVLKWAVQEMEKRYKALSQLGVRNISGYNNRIKTQNVAADQTALQPLPYIVVVVDEMADLMLVAGKEVELAMQRLAQMARAAGIHIIMATQRPSVDVITGTLKANFPTRLSFQVASKFDSKTILNEIGAERLLGRGDMLFQSNGGRLSRLQSPFCDDAEVRAVCNELRKQGTGDYIAEIFQESGNNMIIETGSDEDDMYQQALEIVIREQRASTSFIQRQLQVGYNRAARLVEQMEKEGHVSPADRVGRRKVLTGRVETI